MPRSGGLEMARASELAGEGLVQQRLLQRLQRGELSLVEGGEALGFFRQRVELCDGSTQFRQWCQRNLEATQHFTSEMLDTCAAKVLLQLSARVLD